MYFLYNWLSFKISVLSFSWLSCSWNVHSRRSDRRNLSVVSAYAAQIQLKTFFYHQLHNSLHSKMRWHEESNKRHECWSRSAVFEGVPFRKLFIPDYRGSEDGERLLILCRDHRLFPIAGNSLGVHSLSFCEELRLTTSLLATNGGTTYKIAYHTGSLSSTLTMCMHQVVQVFFWTLETHVAESISLR